MKKVLAGVVAGLAFGAVSSASELDMSAGGGVFFVSDFGGGLYGVSDLMYGKTASTVSEVTNPWAGGGVHAFFDATYASSSLDFTYARTNRQELQNGNSVQNNDTAMISFIGLGFSVFLKYPIELTKDVSLFPMAGMDYAFIFSGQIHNEQGDRRYKLGESVNEIGGNFNTLWFKFGVGIDCDLTSALFLRPELLYGVRLSNKYERDYKYYNNNNQEVDPVLGHGITAKVGLGYKF